MVVRSYQLSPSNAYTDNLQQRPIVGGFKIIYKAGAILRAFNPYRAPYIPLIFISICKERYFLLIHKYTKEYSGSQIYPHISLYTLSIQKYKYILFGGKISLLYIKYIPTLHAYSHAYMDSSAHGISV